MFCLFSRHKLILSEVFYSLLINRSVPKISYLDADHVIHFMEQKYTPFYRLTACNKVYNKRVHFNKNNIFTTSKKYDDSQSDPELYVVGIVCQVLDTARSPGLRQRSWLVSLDFFKIWLEVSNQIACRMVPWYSNWNTWSAIQSAKSHWYIYILFEFN